MRAAILVHGGAGQNCRAGERLERYRRGLVAAVHAGMAELVAGSGPLAAVEAAVRSMEADGAFNAGRGSSLDLQGQISCDAAVMRGADLAAGACGAVRGVLHPVTLARAVLERTDHVLLVAEGAERLARALGLEPLAAEPPAEQRARWEQLRAARQARPARPSARLRALLATGAEDDLPPPAPAAGEPGRAPTGAADTVGAVAIDAGGRLAAAVSTGGLWLKLPGRVGDSAIIGAGLLADDEAGAASATGIGEAILKISLARAVIEAMRAGASAQAACAAAVAGAARRFGAGTAGVIAIDRAGRPGAATNTPFMGRAWLAAGMDTPWVGLEASQPQPPAFR
ncbi:MAG: asparaginase [Planctomycetota bacterium]|nr:MAG: asparaginase [Planctomycetota bacterium]